MDLLHRHHCLPQASAKKVAYVCLSLKHHIDRNTGIAGTKILINLAPSLKFVNEILLKIGFIEMRTV